MYLRLPLADLLLAGLHLDLEIRRHTLLLFRLLSGAGYGVWGVGFRV